MKSTAVPAISTSIKKLTEKLKRQLHKHRKMQLIYLPLAV